MFRGSLPQMRFVHVERICSIRRGNGRTFSRSGLRQMQTEGENFGQGIEKSVGKLETDSEEKIKKAIP